MRMEEAEKMLTEGIAAGDLIIQVIRVRDQSLPGDDYPPNVEPATGRAEDGTPTSPDQVTAGGLDLALQSVEFEQALDALNEVATRIADRLDRMHYVQEDINRELRGAHDDIAGALNAAT